MGPAPTGPGSDEGMGPAPTGPDSDSKPSGLPVKALVIAAVAVVVLVVGGVVGWKALSGSAGSAAVGDCLAGENKDEIKPVKCDDPAARHKVVGKLKDKTEADLDAASKGDNPCSAYPTAESAFWEGEKGGKGYILCLEPVKK
ncbi:LppU/SCO3897 family protein [Micromonospora zhanjiangensis]|uniref:Septum formation-related domain-containing protein n=1 Tax=Micromonospora zhanjiangensis TaxID=1522057 RepID=A0ABV8KRP2_9ACTN